MIADIIASAIAHPFVTGLLIGGMAFGGPLGVLGWLLGYEAAMRKTSNWMREKLEALDVHGDVPMLPPARDRRFSSVAHREWLS